jgi:hypothetical protein
MKITGGLAAALFVGFGLVSCFDPPEYPVVPEIEFKGITFKDVPDETDSLIIELYFKDGDGNLGLSSTELACYNIDGKDVCFLPKFEFVVNTGPNRGKKLNYAIKRTDPLFADLPNYVKPYDCINWELEKNIAGQVIDTVYIQLNPDHYNIFVDYLVKQADGTFKEFDFREEFCSTYDGRFPILSKNLSQKNPLEGIIRYGMPGLGFDLFFSIKTLKLRIQIQDRVLNKSNIIETPEFTLQSIKG